MSQRTVRMTLTLPADLLQAIDRVVHAGKTRSHNEFVTVAGRHELVAQKRAAVDAACAEMAHDPMYQAEAYYILQACAAANWEALRCAEGAQRGEVYD